jgi:hypothetical protein
MNPEALSVLKTKLSQRDFAPRIHQHLYKIQPWKGLFFVSNGRSTWLARTWEEAWYVVEQNELFKREQWRA